MVIFTGPDTLNEPVELLIFKIAYEVIFKFKSFKFVQFLKLRPFITRIDPLKRDNFVTIFIITC